MAEIIDSIVNISINDAISSVTTTDVNTMAIVGAAGKSGAVAGEYSTLKAIKEAFNEGDTDCELVKMAAAFFDQPSQPEKLVCIPLGSAGLDGVIQAAADAGLEFYHVCAATSADNSDDLGDIYTVLSDTKKRLHIQASNDTIAKAYQAKLAADGIDRVYVYLQPAADKYMNVALVAARCANDSARGTFAHKKLANITAGSYSKDKFDELTGLGINIYCKAQGEARVFFGTGKDKSTFIDNGVKEDWVRFSIQSKIYQLLGEANDGNGVTYDDPGIDSVAAAILQVFAKAADSDHQYIMEGYSVSYKPYAYLAENEAAKVRERTLPLVKANYKRMNSIHTAKTIQLNVTL